MLLAKVALVMDLEAAIVLVDREVYHHTNKHLNDLQQTIITQVWQGRKYLEIADEYGCTEGHAKDTGSLLWQLLSSAWGNKVTKGNFCSLIKRQLHTITNSQTAIASGTVGSRDIEPIEADDSFVGRQQAIATLKNLVARGNKVIVIQGEGGVGKTTLAQQFLSALDGEIRLEVLIAKETANIISAAAVVEEWLQRDLNEDSGKEFGVTLARFKRYLERHRVKILIDNLEPALDKNGRFVKAHRDYIELLRILADSRVQSTTIITSRDRLCEGEINSNHYRLSGLDLLAWQQYFAAYRIKSNNTIEQIHDAYGGNAKAMKMICAIVREDYAGNIEHYWQENDRDPLIETDLKNLVVSQFERLRQLDEPAYRLLCRLGCYRERGISHAELMCLLWDVERNKQRVIKSLRNRSLLEYAQSKHWLHPIVQTEAKTRLQFLPEWEQSHREIAEFLTGSIVKIVNIADGLTALEAYYYYTAIQDYAAAAKVILHSRENQWGQFLTLGTTLYRLGIVEPVLVAVEQIIPHIEHDRHRSELDNILGDLYWTTGKVRQAIACQHRTITTSRNCYHSLPPTLENRHDLYYWRMLEVDSLLSLGLYHIDLGELSHAANLFQQVIALAHNTKHHSWSEKANVGLALVDAYLVSSKPLNPTVSKLYRSIVELEDPFYNTGRFAYFMQMIGQILFHHRQIESAKIIWRRAIAFAQSGHYIQIEAKSLIGLGNIERQANNLASANAYHQQAVKLLEKIAAKCDLAAAYLQWGITLQRDLQIAKSNNCFTKAIAIYQKISAPRQVEKAIALQRTDNRRD